METSDVNGEVTHYFFSNNEVQVENFEDKDLLEVLDGNLSNDSITDFIFEKVVDDNNIELTDNDVFIDGKFYTPEEFGKI